MIVASTSAKSKAHAEPFSPPTYIFDFLSAKRISRQYRSRIEQVSSIGLRRR